jgi:hypothetical protein
MKKAKPVKRKDGKPTRAQRSKTNSASFKQAKRDLSMYMPPVARARYQAIIDEMAKGGKLDTPVEQQKAVLSLIIGGLSLRWAREIVGVTHYQWHTWLAESEDLKKEYVLSKDERAEAWADDIMEDAESANAFNVNAVRLRIETKKWLMGKNSGRYADKQIISGDPDNPIGVITASMPVSEAQAIYRQLKDRVKA